MRARAVFCVVGLVALMGCSAHGGNEGGGGGSAGEGGAGSEKTLAWEPCHDSFECATLLVPVDYDDPNGESTQLRILRARATGAREGVFVYQDGGPGLPSVKGLAALYPAAAIALPKIAEHYDVVAFDWRGTGESGALECDIDAPLAAVRAMDDAPAGDAERSSNENAMASVYAGCASATDPARIAGMSTANAARDLDRIREALGEDELNLLGLSWGAYFGGVYASLFPHRVRAFVLDSPASPKPAISELVARWVGTHEAHLTRMLAACGEDASCLFHGGEGAAALDAAYAALMGRVAAGEIAGRGSPISPTQAARAVAGFVGASDEAGLRAALSAAEAGDGMALLEAARAYYDAEFVITTAIICQDKPDFEGGYEDYWSFLDQLEVTGPRLGRALGMWWGVCAGWPERSTSHVTIHAPAAAPLMVVAGPDDIWTPAINADEMVASLGNRSLLLRGDQPGHVQTNRSACVRSQIQAFILDPSSPPPDLDCSR